MNTICNMFANPRSDIPIKIWGADAFLNTEGSRTHAVVRERGHYFGNCIAFDPPDKAPVGMDNKVVNFLVYNHVDIIYALFSGKR